MGGRGSSFGGGSEIKGSVTFDKIIKASPNFITFSKIVTVSPDKTLPYSGKKKDLGKLIERANINDVVVNMYRDKSGANDLKRMQNLGFTVQASYKGTSEGSRPPRDYYYLKRKKK